MCDCLYWDFLRDFGMLLPHICQYNMDGDICCPTFVIVSIMICCLTATAATYVAAQYVQVCRLLRGGEDSSDA